MGMMKKDQAEQLQNYKSNQTGSIQLMTEEEACNSTTDFLGCPTHPHHVFCFASTLIKGKWTRFLGMFHDNHFKEKTQECQENGVDTWFIPGW